MMVEKITKLLVCKVFFFFFYSSYVLRLLYTPVYFKQLGMSPSNVGIITGTGLLLRAFGGLLFCYLADKANLRRTIFLLSLLATAATPFLCTLPKPHKQLCPRQVSNPLESVELNSTGTIPRVIHDNSTGSKRRVQKFVIDSAAGLFNHENNQTLKGESKGLVREPFPKMSHFLVPKQNQTLGLANYRHGKVKPIPDFRKDLIAWRLGGQSTKVKSAREGHGLSITSRAYRRERRKNKEKTPKYYAELLGLYGDQGKYLVSGKSLKDSRKEMLKPVSLAKMSKTKPVKKRISITNTSSRQDENSMQESFSEMRDIFVLLLAITSIGDFVSGPSRNLADTVVIDALEDDISNYGKIRLWGNIGQMVVIPLVSVGVFFKKTLICGSLQDDNQMAMYILTVGLTLALMIGFKFYFPSSKVVDDDKKRGRENQETFKKLITPLRNWSLLLIALFLGMFEEVFSTFMFWYIVDMEQSRATLVIGLVNMLRNISAFLTFLASPYILKMVGTINAVNVALILYFIAFLTYSLLSNPWLAIIPEVIQYMGYALSMSSCVSFFGEVAPDNLAATSQGLLQFIYGGFGQSIGPVVGGFIMDRVGGSLTFLIFGGISFVVLLFSLIIQQILNYQTRKIDYHPVSTREAPLSPKP